MTAEQSSLITPATGKAMTNNDADTGTLNAGLGLTSRVMPEGWSDAYAAFVGAFDTPVARRTMNNEFADDARRRMREFNEAMLQTAPAPTEPIPMVLHCPKCRLQHIDAPEPHEADENEPSRPGGLWDNPPHRSHLCLGCGHIWRPADVPTVGVERISTRGKADSPVARQADGGAALDGWREVAPAGDFLSMLDRLSGLPIGGGAANFGDTQEHAALRAYFENVSLLPEQAGRVPDARLTLLAKLARHAGDCTWTNPLPTGGGTWGCSCGLDQIVLDGELLDETPPPPVVPKRAQAAEPVPGAVWEEGGVSLVRRGTEDERCRTRGSLRLYTIEAIERLAEGDSQGLDARMKAAGMMTVEELLSTSPINRFLIHASMKSLDDFGAWLEMKAAEYLKLQAKHELEKREDDELYEWAVAHAGAFRVILLNFKAAQLAAGDPSTGVAGSAGSLDPAASNATQQNANRWQWARKKLMSLSHQGGPFDSSEFNHCPIGEANTPEYWDRVADRAMTHKSTEDR